MNRYFGSEPLNRVLIAFVALYNLIWKKRRPETQQENKTVEIEEPQVEDMSAICQRCDHTQSEHMTHNDCCHCGCYEFTTEAPELCARCGHTQKEHDWFALECLSCECSGYIEAKDYTESMKAEWKKQCFDLQYYDELYRQYYENEYDDANIEDADLPQHVVERRYQWGEGITMHFRHPLLGFTSLTMLEGEWIQSIKEMRNHKTLPSEVIDRLEQEIESARTSLHPDYSYDDLDEDEVDWSRSGYYPDED